MRRRGTSYHFGPELIIWMSLSLKALVSAGMDEAANNDASNVILLFRAILTRKALAQLPKISFERRRQSQVETPLGTVHEGCGVRSRYSGVGEEQTVQTFNVYLSTLEEIFAYAQTPPRSLWTERLPLPATRYVSLRCRAKMIPIETTSRNLCQPHLAEEAVL